MVFKNPYQVAQHAVLVNHWTPYIFLRHEHFGFLENLSIEPHGSDLFIEIRCRYLPLLMLCLTFK